MKQTVIFLSFGTFLASACGGSSQSAPALSPTAATVVTGHEDRAEWAKKEGLLLKRFDLSRDGQPDIFKFYREADDPKNPGNKLEELVRKDVDLNHDNSIDVIYFYDHKGQVIEERWDLDFDGRFDMTRYLKDGLRVREELDLDYAGKPDVFKYYDNGQLARIESDRNGDGRIDTWEYFVNDELDRIGTDADQDGIADTWDRKKSSEGTTPTDSAKPSADAAGAGSAVKP